MSILPHSAGAPPGALRLLWAALGVLAFLGLSGCPDPDPTECEAARDLTELVTQQGTHTDSTVGLPNRIEPWCAPAGGTPERFLRFTAPDTGRFVVHTASADTSFDTVLYAFSDCADPEGTSLGCNDDLTDNAGWVLPGDPSELGEDFAYTSALSLDLEAGQEVIIGVDGYSDGEEGAFDIRVESLVCGDGRVVVGEDCEDGNTTNGDGCDSECHLECEDDVYDAVEDEDFIPLSVPSALIEDLVMCPTDGDDSFILSLDLGESVRVMLEPGGTLTTSCEDLRLYVGTWGMVLVPLRSDDACLVYGFEALETEDYLIEVLGFVPMDYSLRTEVALAVCGDGIAEGDEECDDGAAGSDACTSSCIAYDPTCDPLESWGVASPEGLLAEGSTEGAADTHTPSCGYSVAGDAVYELQLDHDSIVVASLGNSSTDFDTVLHVRTDCLDPGSEVACNDDSVGLASRLAFQAEAGVPYYVVVDGYGFSEGAYALELWSPLCGDGELEFGEDCDDANTVSGDGCEADCSWTPFCELDPTEDLGVLPSGSSTWTVDLSGQEDSLPDLECSGIGGADAMVRFGMPVPGLLYLEAWYPGGDVQVGLFRESGTVCDEVLACEDYGEWAEYGEHVAWLTSGDYFLVVDSWGGDTDLPDVPVEITITAP